MSEPPGMDEVVEFVLPLVVRVERDVPPGRTDALVAAARGALLMLTSDEPAWREAVEAWDGQRIRKVVRRARGADWRRALTIEGIDVREGTAELRVHPPVPIDGWPPELARLQVAGTNLEDVAEPGPPPPGRPLVLLSPHAGMTTGKAMAQAAHAAQLGWRETDPDGRARWRDAGFPLAVRDATLQQWQSAVDAGAPVVHDGGFTEVEPGTATALFIATVDRRGWRWGGSGCNSAAMPTTHRCTLAPRGRFSLRESIEFGFGQKEADPGATVLRMAFVGDGLRDHAGVVVGAEPDGTITLDIAGGGDPVAVTAQVARILSIDVDAREWDALSDRDPLLARLTRVRPGMRPPLFHSAYEALAWSVLSARRPRHQMAALRDRLAAAHGATFDLAGRSVHAFPTPERLLEVDEFPGLPEVKLRRLHGVARAAVAGELDTAALRALDPDQASAAVQRLEGIGPLYASLVVIRALGHTDVPPAQEPLVLGVLAELLGRPGPLTPVEFLEIAEAWKPWRTWASVFVRAAGPRLLPADSVVARKSTAR